MIELHVDASDTVHKILRVRERIPVQQPGDMVLLYPQWETASHAPTLEAAPLAGLIINGGGKPLAWQRDAANPFAFHVDVPDGVAQLDIVFQHLPSPYGPKAISPDMLMLLWSKALLYPAGWYMRNIEIAPELALPKGFSFASSLDSMGANDNLARFKPTTLDDLVDAPAYAGRYVKRYDLSADGTVPVRLTMFGDTEASLTIPTALLKSYRDVAATMPRLFRSQPYRHFDFLMSLSDVLPSGGGTEHQESTEINFPADFFTNASAQLTMANLMVHEFAHAWNGRTYQPADLWQPNLNLPIGGSLLWVYEGQSEFWADVIAPRVGLQTVQQALDALAMEAAKASTRPGRAWKSLQESTRDPIHMSGKAAYWRDWQRRSDYYGEGVLLWLDVDMLMRELSNERHGLAEFAGTFFDGNNILGDRTIHTYTFVDVCNALNKIVPYDWQGYFTIRLQAHDDAHLLDGLARAGYRLVYSETPSAFFQAAEAESGAMDLSLSLGLVVGKTGLVKTVSWEGPAFKAGISLGAQLVRIGKQPYSDEVLKEAIRAAAQSKQPIEVTYNADGAIYTVAISYFDSLRYPHLQRIPGSIDRLGPLFSQGI
jgi:predicted metalloprotease with PDZ domain